MKNNPGDNDWINKEKCSSGDSGADMAWNIANGWFCCITPGSQTWIKYV